MSQYQTTQEQNDYVEQLAAAFMKKSEIADCIDIARIDFLAIINIPDHPMAKAYKRGFLQSKFEVNKKIVELSKAGSSPAQSLASKLILDTELEI